MFTLHVNFLTLSSPVGIYQNQKVEAMIAYGPKGYDYAPFKQLEGLHILPGVSTYCDITHADATKATGIQVILKQYNLDKYICFGDSLMMLRCLIMLLSLFAWDKVTHILKTLQLLSLTVLMMMVFITLVLT